MHLLLAPSSDALVRAFLPAPLVHCYIEAYTSSFLSPSVRKPCSSHLPRHSIQPFLLLTALAIAGDVWVQAAIGRKCWPSLWVFLVPRPAVASQRRDLASHLTGDTARRQQWRRERTWGLSGTWCLSSNSSSDSTIHTGSKPEEGGTATVLGETHFLGYSVEHQAEKGFIPAGENY